MGKVLLTGSRVYGPITDNSDIDIVMEKTDATKLLNVIETLGLVYEMMTDYGEASSYKFYLTGLPPINIIIAQDDVAFFEWEYATNKMKEVAAIIDRGERLNMFHKLKTEGFNIIVGKKNEEFFELLKKSHARFSNEIAPQPVNDKELVDDITD